MALSYNYSTLRIAVPSGDAQPLLMQSLINSIRAQEASEQGIAYNQIADASGKNDLGGGVTTGITVALRSSWKIDFSTGSYQATVTGGNLADALGRIHNTGNPQVLFLASAAATLVETGTSGLTPEESALLSLGINQAQLTLKLIRNKQITDPATGRMVVYDDDGTTVLVQGDLFEDAAGTTPYRGQDAERRERLE